MAKKNQGQPKRPSNFATPVECIKWIKKSVYLIARGRALNADKPNELTWFTIGTGCVVAPNRIVTAAHVIIDPSTDKEISKHRADDKYYLIKHDDEGNWHFRFFTPQLDKELFLYPDIDLAVLYLEDAFYSEGEHVFALKDDFIRVDQKFRMIGTQIAVLGYPLSRLEFNEGDVSKPKVGDILLRADSGIINSRYRIAEEVYRYEFTVAFNPGNSGGPIFDLRTGQLLSIVHGYKALPISKKEHVFSEDEKKLLNLKEYTETAYIDIVHANYSVGYATPSFVNAFREHRIIT